MNTKASSISLPQLSVWHHLLQHAPEKSPVLQTRERRSSQVFPRLIKMEKGKVISFTQESDAHHIAVFGGALWLTETPANTDVVLEEGEGHAIGRHLPVVVQALTDSVIALS